MTSFFDNNLSKNIAIFLKICPVKFCLFLTKNISFEFSPAVAGFQTLITELVIEERVLDTNAGKQLS